VITAAGEAGWAESLQDRRLRLLVRSKLKPAIAKRFDAEAYRWRSELHPSAWRENRARYAIVPRACDSFGTPPFDIPFFSVSLLTLGRLKSIRRYNLLELQPTVFAVIKGTSRPRKWVEMRAERSSEARQTP